MNERSTKWQRTTDFEREKRDYAQKLRLGKVRPSSNWKKR